MAKKNNNQVSAVRQAKHGWIWTLAFTVISILWIAPILVVLLNSFKRKAFIFRHPFTLGTEPLSAVWDKFIHGVERAFCGWLNSVSYTHLDVYKRQRCYNVYKK